MPWEYIRQQTIHWQLLKALVDPCARSNSLPCPSFPPPILSLDHSTSSACQEAKTDWVQTKGASASSLLSIRSSKVRHIWSEGPETRGGWGRGHAHAQVPKIICSHFLFKAYLFTFRKPWVHLFLCQLSVGFLTPCTINLWAQSSGKRPWFRRGCQV